MTRPDLNLLVALEILLAEVSVARAAKRLQLSPSAMSRTLARLRETTGDPLLVRAGRRLVATPRALELRAKVGQVVHDAEALLGPVAQIEVQQLARTFTLRTSEGFVETFGPALLARVSAEAPRVRLRFVQKSDKDSDPLREGRIDLETGVVETNTGPELRTQALFRDRWIGVVRRGHPLSRGRVTPARYAKGKHISTSRADGGTIAPLEAALRKLGYEREIVALLAGGFATAIALARASDLIATVPEGHTEKVRTGMHSFELPVVTPEFTISMLWHPRLDADAAHRWLRECVRDVCTGALEVPPRHEGGRARGTKRSGRTARR